MTISLAWVRRKSDTVELILASDSRLRSYGAIDQAQKLFRLERGDCCLGFCGDAQIAYPLFVQIGSAFNAFIKTRTRASDVTEVIDQIKEVASNLIASWDLDEVSKAEELKSTKIMFAGWSWRYSRFEIGAFRFIDGRPEYHRERFRLPHSWKEKSKSLMVIGDYEAEYSEALDAILSSRHGLQPKGFKKIVDFDYEPVEALAYLLRNAKSSGLSAVGGAPQLVKIYRYGSDLPIVTRVEGSHFLLGRKLASWEKTTYPILNLEQKMVRFSYPMASIPLPADVKMQEAESTSEQDIPHE